MFSSALFLVPLASSVRISQKVQQKAAAMYKDDSWCDQGNLIQYERVILSKAMFSFSKRVWIEAEVVGKEGAGCKVKSQDITEVVKFKQMIFITQCACKRSKQAEKVFIVKLSDKTCRSYADTNKNIPFDWSLVFTADGSLNIGDSKELFDRARKEALIALAWSLQEPHICQRENRFVKNICFDCAQSAICRSLTGIKFLDQSQKGCMVRYKGAAIDVSRAEINSATFAERLNNEAKTKLCSTALTLFNTPDGKKAYVTSDKQPDCSFRFFEEKGKGLDYYTVPYDDVVYDKYDANISFLDTWDKVKAKSATAAKVNMDWCQNGNEVSFVWNGVSYTGKVVTTQLPDRNLVEDWFHVTCDVLVTDPASTGETIAVTVFQTVTAKTPA